MQPIFTASAGTTSAGLATAPTVTVTVTAAVAATMTTTTNRDKTGFDTSDPLFRQLVAGISYSRQLAVTYYFVVISTLAVFIAANLISRFRRWQRTKQRRLLKGYRACDNAGRSTSSWSSSPTLCDYNTLPPNEQSPLLKDKRVPNRYNGAFRVCSAIRSWLIAQPATFLFTGQKVPANSTLAFILTYLSINIFYLLYKIQFSVDMLFVLADRAAVLFTTNLPVLYALSAKTQPFQLLIGYSHASLNVLHRRLGEWMSLLALLHGGLMFVVWAVTLRPKEYTFVKFITDKVTIFGLCTITCYQMIYLTSLSRFRQVAYEMFLAIHIILQFGALIFLYNHHSRSRPYVAASLLIWVTDRLLYRLLAKSRTFQATLTIMADGQTVGLNAAVPLYRSNALQRILGLKTVQQGWRALDHIFIRVPTLGGFKGIQSHPFSIASKPPRLEQQTADLGLIIKARGGFTKSLLDYARAHKKVSVQIEGPYGVNAGLQLLRASTTRILIAGGSGIAAIWPLLLELIDQDRQCLGDLEFGTEFSLRHPIFCAWIVSDAAQYSWISESELAALREKFGINILMPNPTKQGKRPDIGRLLADCLSPQYSGERIGIVCSGPDSMTRCVRNECSKLIKSGRSLDLELEKYAW